MENINEFDLKRIIVWGKTLGITSMFVGITLGLIGMFALIVGSIPGIILTIVGFFAYKSSADAKKCISQKSSESLSILIEDFSKLFLMKFIFLLLVAVTIIIYSLLKVLSIILI